MGAQKSSVNEWMSVATHTKKQQHICRSFEAILEGDPQTDTLKLKSSEGRGWILRWKAMGEKRDGNCADVCLQSIDPKVFTECAR